VAAAAVVADSWRQWLRVVAAAATAAAAAAPVKESLQQRSKVATTTQQQAAAAGPVPTAFISEGLIPITPAVEAPAATSVGLHT
jgi:hypothetical protein